MVVGDSLELNCTEATGVDEYWICGATNDPYFEPVLTGGFENRVGIVPAGTTTWSSDHGITDSASGFAPDSADTLSIHLPA